MENFDDLLPTVRTFVKYYTYLLGDVDELEYVLHIQTYMFIFSSMDRSEVSA